METDENPKGKIVPSFIIHKEKRWIRLEFAYDLKLTEEIKKIPGRKWNLELKCWLVPDQVENRLRFDIRESSFEAKETDLNIYDNSNRHIRAVPFQFLSAEHIKLLFKPDTTIKEYLQKLDEVKWSDTNYCYYISNSSDAINKLINHCRGKVWVDLSALQGKRENIICNPNSKKAVSKLTAQQKLPVLIQDKLEEFRIWMEQHRYSEQTIKNYLNHLSQFFLYLGDIDIKNVHVEDVVRFNHNVIIENKLSISYQRVVTGAIKLFYSHFYDHIMDVTKLDRPFREKVLPDILSKSEIARLLRAPNNIKHRAMLSVIYSCGLRRSELLNLKIVDLDKDRNMIKIVQAKGRKDRYVPYSEKLKPLLREYYFKYKPKEYLFEGSNGGKYSERSIAKVLEQAVIKSGIKKNVHLHTLRHSFATHLHESGTDITYIKEILGHNNLKTTMIYTHLSSHKISEIKSPLDDLDI